MIATAGSVGARLVYTDDIWMYGRVDGPMRKDSPIHPVVYKDVLRALAAEMIQSAHSRGQTETVIRRAAELYGPRAESLLGAALFTPGLSGRRAMCPGDPEDFGSGAGLPCSGRARHHRKRIHRDHRQDRRHLTPAPTAREGAEQLYQFEPPFLLDDNRFRALTAPIPIGPDIGCFPEDADSAPDGYRLDQTQQFDVGGVLQDQVLGDMRDLARCLVQPADLRLTHSTTEFCCG
ncbi:hypothetical protein HNP40_001488 [Mycobacteroides chelonae]|nr:hypothetical protein [Mycobacteroides chelonae]